MTVRERRKDEMFELDSGLCKPVQPQQHLWGLLRGRWLHCPLPSYHIIIDNLYTILIEMHL